MADDKKAKRLAFKDYKKLKRLAQNLAKAQRKHRDWCEAVQSKSYRRERLGLGA